jgi:hypothetical protein
VDIVQRFMQPGDHGYPAHEIAHVFRFWVRGRFNNARALQAAATLCEEPSIPAAEQSQFLALRAWVLEVPSEAEDRLGDIEGGVVLLQTGLITEAEFRTAFGL